LRKIPVLRLNFPRHSDREIVRLSPVSDGYLRKIPVKRRFFANTPPKYDISVYNYTLYKNAGF
jgi:hypothetical protein